MKAMKQIETLEDIRLLVDCFYGKVRQDELLADIFKKVIGNHWPDHLEKMYRFWQTVLLEEHTYNGSPFAPHVKLPVQGKHFERWKLLFYETVDQNFTGGKAEEAKFRATKMAEMFQLKIEYFQNKI
ncbi:group III truncated hemoglobin [Flagellimonas okinawensis]|uniref:Group III truncated hemoglobin n=1 Tax=Flagellimonas okinawensis TaxID=3031324 RepID=A0ABT5XLY7_9FLAO|nr:group III truncated hemoglobin [[Muricauda] okinawensis]MDF0706646.1 group III truncated hemoglobin [[Muricauda] okinawensis]